jgi:hypothetical protein
MNIHFVENKPLRDSIVISSFTNAFSPLQVIWRPHLIHNAQEFQSCMDTLSQETESAIGLHDLHLDLPTKPTTSRFSQSGLSPDLFEHAEHGVELLMALSFAAKASRKETLLVVASTFGGGGRLEALRGWVNGLGAWNIRLTHVLEGFSSNTRGSADASMIAKTWDDYFGCMANRLRASYTLGWFNDESPHHPTMQHSLLPGTRIPAPARREVAEWMSKVFQTPYAVAEIALSTLNGADASFYNNVPRHLCGACALHSGRTAGKRLNMHGLAFIACGYADDVSGVFSKVDWALSGSTALISTTASLANAEELLYALVGRPGERPESAGLFGHLGLNTGQNGGRTGRKTVAKAELKANGVTITFGFNGKELAEKLDGNLTQGGAAQAVLSVKRLLVLHGADLKWAATNKAFTINILKS